MKKIFVAAIIVVASTLGTASATMQSAQAKPGGPLPRAFLPLTASAPISTDPCDALPAEAKPLLALIRNHAEQRRSVITCDLSLIRAAQAHSEDMAVRNFASHVNPDGIGPNYRAKTQGYALPGSYSKDKAANNIESLAAGYDTPGDVWGGLLSSPAHREHMLGLSDFFRNQTKIGIGFAYRENARYQYYWVVVTAP